MALNSIIDFLGGNSLAEGSFAEGSFVPKVLVIFRSSILSSAFSSTIKKYASSELSLPADSFVSGGCDKILFRSAVVSWEFILIFLYFS
jgi:hypothetical protein